MAVALDTFLAKERELALVTYRKRNRGAPATPTHTNEICLNAMTSILSSLDYTNDKILRKPMRCLSRILSNYEPLSLFEQWSPPKACPEIKSRIKAVSWKASPSDTNFPADNVRLGVSSSGDDDGEEKEEEEMEEEEETTRPRMIRSFGAPQKMPTTQRSISNSTRKSNWLRLLLSGRETQVSIITVSWHQESGLFMLDLRRRVRKKRSDVSHQALLPVQGQP